MEKLVDERYGGRTINFVKDKSGMVLARIPAISKRPLAKGADKKEAFDRAKDIIDNVSEVNKNTECALEDLDTRDAVEKYKKAGKVLLVFQDLVPEDPRKEWDNLGIMYCSHSRYTLGDEQFDADQFEGWKEVEQYLIKERGALHIAPLYLYDHSGLRIKIGSFAGLAQHAEWDSGQVGFIFTTKEKMKEMGTPKARINASLKQEVETYDEYLRGSVYRYEMYECKDGDWDMVDSVGGFYGDDMKENGVFESTGEKGWKEF